MASVETTTNVKDTNFISQKELNKRVLKVSIKNDNFQDYLTQT